MFCNAPNLHKKYYMPKEKLYTSIKLTTTEENQGLDRTFFQKKQADVQNVIAAKRNNSLYLLTILYR